MYVFEGDHNGYYTEKVEVSTQTPRKGSGTLPPTSETRHGTGDGEGEGGWRRG